MKSFFNMGMSLVMLGVAVGIVKYVIIPAEPNPLGENRAVPAEEFQEEIDTLRQSK